MIDVEIERAAIMKAAVLLELTSDLKMVTPTLLLPPVR